ncbi:unnamed protein product [Parajaminaea phylloscopi]
MSTARAAWSKYVVQKSKEHVRDLGIIAGSVVFACALWNALSIIERQWMQKEIQRSDAGTGRKAPAVLRAKWAITAAMRKYFTYHVISTPFLLISPTELLVMVAYLITQYVLCFTEGPQAPPTPTAPGLPVARRNYGWTSRAGWLFVASLPWVTLLAMKHNILSLVTGIGYDRLQKLHRGIATVSLSMALIHTAGKLWLKPQLVPSWRSWGLVAAVACGLLFLFSLRPVRNMSYQLFVHGHIILLIVMYVGTWYHVSDVDNSTSKDKPYMIAAFAFWGFDRALRLLNVIWVNGLFRTQKSVTASSTKLTAHSSGLLKLEIIKPHMAKWQPGSHVYIISPPALGRLPILEGHPFTIASVCDVPNDTGSSIEAGNALDKELGAAQARSDSSSLRRLDFFIRPRGGFTRRLAQHALTGEASPNLLVYGPFSPPDAVLHSHETVVLIGAGSGVSWTLPLLLNACHESTQGRTIVKRIVWVWVIKKSSEVDIVRSQILQALMSASGNVTVEVRIYVTQEAGKTQQLPAEWSQCATAAVCSGRSQSSSAPSEKTTRQDIEQPCPVLLQGRPQISALLEGVVEQSSGRVWIGVSGPTHLTLDVKRCARRLINPTNIWRGNGSGDVSVHAEVFGW